MFEKKTNTDRPNELDSSRDNLGHVPLIVRPKSMDLRVRETLRFMVHATLTYVALGLTFLAGLVYLTLSLFIAWPFRATMIWSLIGILGLYVAWLEHKP